MDKFMPLFNDVADLCDSLASVLVPEVLGEMQRLDIVQCWLASKPPLNESQLVHKKGVAFRFKRAIFSRHTNYGDVSVS